MMHPGEEEKGAAPTAGTSSQIRDCDIIIGVRIRTLRETRKQTQKGLAEACGISPPQIQKYECGQNRISVARLLDIARALDVEPVYFIDDLDESGHSRAHSGADPVEVDGGQGLQASRVGRWWSQITDPLVKTHLRELMRTLAAQETEPGKKPRPSGRKNGPSR
ncbi:MAG TPA: hypothetical protein DD390_10390 [Rhodospirillaceae bacterium]|nr:hypothetical protein [Rhodospirillaceae bacterium]MAX61889.1 hypothetical protein [Rhodospirillaceae bacterium]HBM13092.1 hypothetical protein [Rhodospirillaceae bacterium]|tara:strand:+ start:770 stop:1261 length:492 start_codon:yes stop_codon:yes gene_type:complete